MTERGADSLADDTTLEAARNWLAKKLPEGVLCPCCDQHAKIYKRPLNSSMAYVLMLLYRDAIDQGGAPWVHVPSLIAMKVKDPEVAAAVRGDWAKLKHWGLIEEGAEATNRGGAPHAGVWRITPRGIRFGSGSLTVAAYVYLYNGELVHERCAEPDINIYDALGKAFSWREIMERAA